MTPLRKACMIANTAKEEQGLTEDQNVFCDEDQGAEKDKDNRPVPVMVFVIDAMLTSVFLASIGVLSRAFA